ncbi:hypothetical protein CERSUDRAFT_78586 [Gelatoporia subvermispora B]|uniref:Uncharacterized protein n=1 Tax=Ceriporiopsis subvermispora (strain B) TaxID=914234 RepID=M2P6F6_CERS8|nr:hypothetical protein CERSUDRAFT_78586 [Gelatoporia subvermispora B]
MTIDGFYHILLLSLDVIEFSHRGRRKFASSNGFQAWLLAWTVNIQRPSYSSPPHCQQPTATEMSSKIAVKTRIYAIWQKIWDHSVTHITWQEFCRIVTKGKCGSVRGDGSRVRLYHNERTFIMHNAHGKAKDNRLSTAGLRSALQEHMLWDADMFVLRE